MALRGDTIEKWVLRIGGFTGLAVFATFYAFTWAMPHWVEDFAADYVQGEVVEQVEGQIEAFRPPTNAGLIGELASHLYERNEQEIAQLKRELQVRARELIPRAIEQVRDPSCECRQSMLSTFLDGNALRLGQLIADNERLKAFIQANYLRVVGDLKREIRIFTGINALSFVLLLLISYAKPAAAKHLLFPGVLLLCATLFCAWLYVSSQNWLITIIQGSYVGFAYAAYLGVIYAFLCDIAFNRGRVTTAFGNVLLAALGSAVALSPC